MQDLSFSALKGIDIPCQRIAKAVLNILDVAHIADAMTFDSEIREFFNKTVELAEKACGLCNFISETLRSEQEARSK